MDARQLLGHLGAHGLLLVQDAELPSVTTILAGEVVSGSWWGHPAGQRIWHALQAVEPHVATVKLLRGKVTLVHRGWWGALAAVGAEHAAWQIHGLRDDASHVLDQVTALASLRTDRVSLPAGARRMGAIANDLERRLLVASTQVHTDRGHHARVLSTWARWLADLGVHDAEPIDPVDGRLRLEDAVRGQSDVAPSTVLPW